MKYIPSIITMLLLLWPLPVSLGEAGIAWDILNEEAQEPQDKRQYNRAVIVAKKARERRRSTPTRCVREAVRDLGRPTREFPSPANDGLVPHRQPGEGERFGLGSGSHQTARRLAGIEHETSDY